MLQSTMGISAAFSAILGYNCCLYWHTKNKNRLMTLRTANRFLVFDFVLTQAAIVILQMEILHKVHHEITLIQTLCQARPQDLHNEKQTRWVKRQYA